MPLLEITNLCIRFGGLNALTKFNFCLEARELVALIGPNGAGKTTVFNLVTGVYAPTSGQVRLDGRRIDGLSPVAISRAGLARTFQNIRLFQNLTVLDNVIVALNNSAEHGLASTMLRGPRFQRESRLSQERGMDLLATMRLGQHADRLAGGLPYGDQRRLEIARALATGPRVLLLDEPAAGMNPREKIELMELIGFIRDRFGVAVWLIEHDMHLVMSVSQRITVLDHGEMLAVGTPEQIQANPKVIEAYLGEPA